MRALQAGSACLNVLALAVRYLDNPSINLDLQKGGGRDPIKGDLDPGRWIDAMVGNSFSDELAPRVHGELPVEPYHMIIRGWESISIHGWEITYWICYGSWLPEAPARLKISSLPRLTLRQRAN